MDKGGQRRSSTSEEVGEYHNMETLRVVEVELTDEQERATFSTSGRVAALRDGFSGYNEEVEDESEIINVVSGTEENMDCQEDFTSEIQEINPVDRRLREKRCFNEGDWKSVELKSLYDGIATYGTTMEALDVIHKKFCSTRTLSEIVAKVKEIRILNSEYEEDRIKLQMKQWVRTGYRNVRPTPSQIIPPEIDNWEAAIQRVNRQIRSHNDYAVRTAITEALSVSPMDARNPKLYKVTDFHGGRGFGKVQPVSWQRLRKFFIGVVEHRRPLPPLNALECAIALRMVDEVEDEVNRLLTDEEKAIIRGWMMNIKIRDLRDFLPDTPYSVRSATQMLLDPLHTFRWKTAEDNSEIPMSF